MKRRYYILPVPNEPLAIVYGAFSDFSAECYAKAQGLTIAGGSYFAESVAVRDVQAKYGRCLVSRQRLVH